jgi:hypothetical protein
MIRHASAVPESAVPFRMGTEKWRQYLIGYWPVNRTTLVSIVLTGGGVMDSRVASDDRPATSRMSPWAASFRRWLGALHSDLVGIN